MFFSSSHGFLTRDLLYSLNYCLVETIPIPHLIFSTHWRTFLLRISLRFTVLIIISSVLPYTKLVFENVHLVTVSFCRMMCAKAMCNHFDQRAHI